MNCQLVAFWSSSQSSLNPPAEQIYLQHFCSSLSFLLPLYSTLLLEISITELCCALGTLLCFVCSASARNSIGSMINFILCTHSILLILKAMSLFSIFSYASFPQPLIFSYQNLVLSHDIPWLSSIFIFCFWNSPILTIYSYPAFHWGYVFSMTNPK